MILNLCQIGKCLIYGSDAIKYEIMNNKDDIKRQKVEKLYSIESEHIVSNLSINSRAKEINAAGFGVLYSLHLAYSEHAKVDMFLTTDDALIKKTKSTNVLEVRVENPVKWILEVR